MSTAQVIGGVMLFGFAGVALCVALYFIGSMLWTDIRHGRYDSLVWVLAAMGFAAFIGVGAYLWRYG